MHPNLSIRVAAVVLTNDAGQVALVRKYQTTALIFPGGKPEPGETARAAAARELHEELGIVVAAEDLVHVGSTPHRPPMNLKRNCGLRFTVRPCRPDNTLARRPKLPRCGGWIPLRSMCRLGAAWRR